MIIRGVRFNYAFDQSGVRNFDGKGYPFHQYLHWVPGFDFTGSSFTAKTTTWESRLGKSYGEPGNMEMLRDGMTPAEFKPRCIYVTPYSWIRGAALNAVGLAGPGINALLAMQVWQDRAEPFQISLMALAKSRSERLHELSNMVSQIKQFLPFRSEFGVQLNISCPNVEHEEEVGSLVSETRESLAILRRLGDKVPLLIKIDALFPVWAALAMCQDENCDGFCNSNAINWIHIPAEVRRKLFGTTESPLADLGGGGLSGASWLFDKVEAWIRQARAAGITKPIIGGGGILNVRQVDRLAWAGASAIAVGSVAFMRPWRVKKIIAHANELGRDGEFYGKCS
ncbi:MAG: hypothetical protein WDN47_03045 [Candidatus Doudnabacteria bacterium]